MMSKRRLLGLAIRIIEQFRRDPRTLALMFIAPILIISLIWWIYDTDPEPRLFGVVQEENTLTATAIVAALNGSGNVEAEVIPGPAASKVFNDGDVDALLYIPADYDPANPASSPLSVTIDGSDPQRASATLSALSQSLTRSAFQALGLDGNLLQPKVTYQYGNFNRFDTIAPVLIAFFAFFFTFLLASVSFLRERMTGTYEQLTVSPITRSEIMTGYSIGFGIFAILQAVLIILFVVFVLKADQSGSVLLAIFVTILLTLGTVSLGIFLSAFARTELQVVQFIPIVVVPQIFLSGLLFPVDSLPEPLQYVSKILPLTYATEALQGVMLRGEGITDIWGQILFLLGFALLMIAAGSLSLRQEE